MRYQIITLVDITRSNANRSETDRVLVGQQANFNSLIQAIGMRSNIEWVQDPQRHSGRIPNQDGKAVHWIWEFDVEREHVFRKDDDPVGHLIDDLNNVPIVSDLTNSADLTPPAFQTRGDNINTWLSLI